MLKKLRHKFIALNMVIVFLVISSTFTIICVINYEQNQASVYEDLTAAIDDAQSNLRLSTLNINDNADLLSNKQSDTQSNSQSNTQENTQDSQDTQNNQNNQNDQSEQNNQDTQDNQTTPLNIGGRTNHNSSTPIAVYYLLDSQLSLNSGFLLSQTSTAALSSSVLQEAIRDISSSSPVSINGYSRGKLNDLGLYYVYHTNLNSSLVAFADTNAASSWEQLAIILLLVGCAVLLVFLLVSIFFARWALHPVEEAWTQQQRFIADASHEIKTPLTVILANTSIIKSHPESSIAEQEQWISSTETEARRMQELVIDMIELAQPAQSKDLQLEVLDFSDLVENEVLQFESVAYERGLKLESMLEPSLTVNGTRSRLARVVAILLDNACKHAANASCITVSLTHTNKQAILSVHNEGSPIPPEDLPHIFDRFYQVDKARTKSKETGFGLGLAIAKESIEAFGGSLNVASSLDQGTVFTVCLALHKAS